MYEHVTVNNTFAQLSAGINAAAVLLNFTVGHGLRIPVIATPQFLFGTLIRVQTGELERIKITAHANGADVCTIVRGVDGTAPLTFLAGDLLELRIGTGDWSQLPRIGFLEAVLAAGGTVNAITATLAATGLTGTVIPNGFTIGLIGGGANEVNNPTFNLSLPDGASGAKTIVKGNLAPLAGGDIGTFAWLQFNTAADKWILLNPVYGGLQAGDYVDSLSPAAARTGFLRPSGAAVSRTTYAALLEASVRRAVVTATIANPSVWTWVGNAIPDNGEVTLATTGNLPTGFAVNTVYYWKALTADTGNLSLTPGGAAINGTVGQAGVHTMTFYPHGAGDGTTTFNLPHRKGRARIDEGTGALTISVDASAVNPATDAITIPTNIDTAINCMKGRWTTTGVLPTGLAAATDYWIVRTGANTFKCATSLALAQNGSVVDITATGNGVHTFTQTLSTRVLGTKGGDETHGLTSVEDLAHQHGQSSNTGSGGSSGLQPFSGNGVKFGPLAIDTFAFGGNSVFNIMGPYGVDTFWVKT